MNKNEIRDTLRAKIDAKKINRLNKKVKEQKINNLQVDVDKELKQKYGEDYNFEQLMSSFLNRV